MNEGTNQMTVDQIEVIKAQSAAAFALTPIGQQIKQFETQQRMAKMYSESTIVPDTYKGNLGNCVIALDMAMRMNANPLMIMQNLYIVHGNPGWSSKFLIATINASGQYARLRYEWKGTDNADDWSCRCYTYEADDKLKKEPLYGQWVSIGMAKAEGWFNKNGSKWKTMPGQMLMYRAAAFWQRTNCPEIGMGLMTAEELHDTAEDQGYGVQSVEEEIKQKANVKTIKIDTTASEQPISKTEANQEQNGSKPEAGPKQQEAPVGASDDVPAWMQ